MGRNRAGWLRAALALLAAGLGASLTAQDTRTVTEPVIPQACTVLQAQQSIVAGEPASETLSDTARIQAALTAAATCTTGSSVELAASGTNNAFLTGPLSIPANITLVVDGGVTLFGSRNPADYQVATAGVETCGTVGSAGNGCQPLLSSTGANSGVMGFGIIDGRGEDKLLVNGQPASYSWWDQAGTAQNVGGAQNNPILLMANAANFTLYKITFRNSPMFHVKWSGNTTTRTGFTAWGVKVITPFTARNSDGIDPSGANILVTNSSLSDGDDMVAVSASSTSQNITVQNTNTYSGHGISVGSYTQGGLSNMLVQNITQMGTAADGNGGGLRIKTSQDRGGLVQNVTYQNICSANVKSPIYLSPYYNTNSGTSYPQFSNITYRNVHVVTEGTITLTGYANTGATVTRTATVNMDNLVVDTIKQTDLSPTPAYLTINAGPGPVTSLLLNQTGTGVSYTGGVTNPTEAPYACNPSTFQYLVGELYGSTASANNLPSATITTNGSVTLNAMLQPAMSQVSYASISGQGSYTGTAAPTAAVQFLEGTRVVGTASLSGNGTLASITLSGLIAGTHTYTAAYAGDANYTVPLSFGNFVVTVAAASPTTTTLTATPATVSYGTSTTLAATVASTASGTPTGQVVFADNGTAQLASQTLSNGTAQTTQVLGVGKHSLQAVYSGDTTFAASTSAAVPVTVNQATPTVTLSSAASTLNFGGTDTLTAMVATSGSGSAPTGSVTFYDGTQPVASGVLNGTATATVTVTPSGGAHSYTAVYSGDANYATATSVATAVAVATASTSTTLAVSTNRAAGLSNTLTATISLPAGFPVAPTGTVTFYAGTAVLGQSTLSGTTATATALLPQGTTSLTAAYSGDANYAASTSSAVSVAVVAPLAVSSSPGSASLAAGVSTTASLAITPGGGYVGTVALSCSSPVAYITCTVTPASQSISGTAGVSGSLTIQVASMLTASNQPAQAPKELGTGNRTWLAMLLPLTAFALRRKRRLVAGLLGCLVMTGLLSLSGCGGSPSTPAANLPPAGTQAVTVTATSATGSIATTTFNVTVTN